MKILKTALALSTAALLGACNNGEELGYERWDDNRDDMLNQEEFTSFWNDENYGADWDSGGDGVVQQKEFDSGLDEFYGTQWEDLSAHSYQDWDLDGDGFIDEDEMTKGTFHAWDENDDQQIDQEEYEKNKYRK